MAEDRKELLEKIWRSQDEAYDLMCEYDALPHHYGDFILYQAEAHVVSLIAQYPDVTVTDLAFITRKSPSACSQTVRKLREKGLVEQVRNRDNNRQLKLQLTELGQKLHKGHAEFSDDCQRRTFEKLDEFTDQELELYLRVQKRINEAYTDDVRRSRDRFT